MSDGIRGMVTAGGILGAALIVAMAAFALLRGADYRKASGRVDPHATPLTNLRGTL